ncbi:DUF6263 family protein [Candidatus Palauibacter sp.]|uniref:DUF6263 family protein n=1 Tax=Candidatus Palauibacter sp. TaxID=3101350 RepID=UPI003B51B65A
MKSVPRGVGAATIALAFALPVSGQTLLRLAPPEGQVSRYAFSVEMTMENPMIPTTGPLMTMRGVQTQTILGAAEEVIRTRTAFDSAEMTVGVPGAGPLPDISGSAFSIDMDPRGRMLNISADATPDGGGQEMVQSFLEGSDYYWLPETGVAAGDTWTQSVAVAMVAPMIPSGPAGPAESMEVEFTYTLAGLEDGRATITFAGPVESSLNMGGVTASLSGELSGSMVVDLTAGRYVRQESRANLELAMAGMTTPTETTMILELLTDSP